MSIDVHDAYSRDSPNDHKRPQKKCELKFTDSQVAFSLQPLTGWLQIRPHGMLPWRFSAKSAICSYRSLIQSMSRFWV